MCLLLRSQRSTRSGLSAQEQRRLEGSFRAEEQRTDPETTQTTLQAAVPAKRQLEEDAWPKQAAIKRRHEVRLRPRTLQKRQDEEEDVISTGGRNSRNQI